MENYIYREPELNFINPQISHHEKAFDFPY